MKKLLWVSLSMLCIASACKTKKTKTDTTVKKDSANIIWEAPVPASNNPDKYDSLKNELNKRRQQKKKKKN